MTTCIDRIARPRDLPRAGGRILIVDDHDEGAMLRAALRRRRYEVETVASGTDALAWLEANEVDVVLAHLRMEGMSGLELCSAVRQAHPDLVTLVLSGSVEITSAVEALRAGAYDYIAKPIDLEALVITIERAVNHVTLGRELRRLRSEVAASRPVPSIVGNSAAIRKVVGVIHQVADTDATLLLVGESGTGKELFARAIHEASSRKDEPFCAINCAAVPAGLLESELFGHVKGAFTDARRDRPGLFQQAGRGTVFLDEIGEMPPAMQVKLLRVLQERKVRPVGGEDEVAIEARVITATNRNLESEVTGKRFREDLYYRINVVQVQLPPLRDRPGDVLMLAQHFIQKIAERTGKPVVALDPDAARLMVDYDWPGNVRELENCLERAIALARFTELSVDTLPDKIRLHNRSVIATATGAPSELVTLAEVEKRYVRHVLDAVGGNKAMAARILGIDRRSLYRRLDGTPAAASDAPIASDPPAPATPTPTPTP